MKQRISIWMLAARGSIYKIIGVFALMAAGQIGAFYWSFQRALQNRQMEIDAQALHPEYGVYDVPYPTLETILKGGYVNVTLIWLIAFVLIAIILSVNSAGGRGTAKTRYLIQRLSVKERTVTAHYAVYNLAVWLIFWAFSAGMALILCQMYQRMAQPGSFGPQSTFLTFYRNGLFHSLLPLAETSRYLRNAFVFLAMALLTAEYGFWSRRGKRSLAVAFATLWFGLNFAKDMGSTTSDWLLICTGIAASAWCIWNVISYLSEGDQE